MTVGYSAIPGITQFNIYRQDGGAGSFGFVGVGGPRTFLDKGAIPDTTDTPPDQNNPFLFADNFPSTVTYHQQRRIFGNTNNKPETIFASRSGAFTNFTTSAVSIDSDALEFTLAGIRVNYFWKAPKLKLAQGTADSYSTAYRT